MLSGMRGFCWDEWGWCCHSWRAGGEAGMGGRAWELGGVGDEGGG